MKEFAIENMFDLNETIAKELFEGKTYPWEVLPEIGAFIKKIGKTLDPEEYEYREGDVWIAKTAKVAPTACINGPAVIGPEAEIRHALEELDTGAYGAVLRAKGIVGTADGVWIHFDFVPGDLEIRHGAADVTGRLCVIGSELKEDGLKTLFGV